jgi:predicted MFS family arabinose efflux permease
VTHRSVHLAAPRAGATPASGAVTGSRHPWLILGAAFLASVAAVLAQFAAPPLMPLVMADFGIDVAQAASLMSVFSITGLVLALPAGAVLARVGPVATGATAMLAVVAGSAIGALAPTYDVLLAGRLVQGVGVGLIGVVAPAVVAATFPLERRGVPMGIWSMWVPVGGVLMYNLAPALGAIGGWQLAWWFACAVAGVALVVYVAVLAALLPRRAAGADHGPPMRVSLRGREIWLLALVFALFAIAASGANTFIPTYLVAEHDVDLAAASAVASLVLLGAIGGSLAGGAISDRIGSRRRVYTAAAVVLAGLLVLPFLVDPSILPPVLLLVGFVSAMIPATVFAAVPEVMADPRSTGSGMAAVMLGQNGAFVVGPIAFSALLAATGWAVAGIAFAVAALACAGVGALTRVR